jgi:hypothetical protein
MLMGQFFAVVGYVEFDVFWQMSPFAVGWLFRLERFPGGLTRYLRLRSGTC